MDAFESRKLERYDLDLPVELFEKGFPQQQASVKLRTVDVSAGGAFFRTEEPLAIGTEVQVEMTLSLDELKKIKGKRALIKVAGAVVRTEKEGMAISFDARYRIEPISSI